VIAVDEDDNNGLIGRLSALPNRLRDLLVRGITFRRDPGNKFGLAELVLAELERLLAFPVDDNGILVIARESLVEDVEELEVLKLARGSSADPVLYSVLSSPET